MSPDERQLLTDLFDRIRGSATTPRDPEAESLIANAVRAQPYAPYFLAQAVIVQNQALEAANQRIEDLQSELQAARPQGQPQGGFLSSLGSIFGAGPSAPPPPEPPRPSRPLPGGPWGEAPQPQPPQSYPPQQPPYASGPWSGPPAAGGGSFLSGALQSAAGVAGGVLLADSIRGLFGGHTGLGGLGLGTGLGGLGGGETVVNDYFEDDSKSANHDGGTDRVDYYDDSDGNDDLGGNDDGSFDV